ncbi:hypothetical protein AYI69_g8980 [Smittium culicis]|uniref:Uncharacterized protein n=1 Tax=Smittium culicis TaxID=133412 RepID=A0A1R1XFU4_9FUNG|nr:hypothetical protein AYI69_g8980 [Smittium culicis]
MRASNVSQFMWVGICFNGLGRFFWKFEPHMEKRSHSAVKNDLVILRSEGSWADLNSKLDIVENCTGSVST